MRRLVFALMMTLLLCGCGGEQDEELYERWRQETQGMTLRFDAAVTALAGSEQTVYRAQVSHAAGETELTLTAPENIAGVTVRRRADEGELCYDGLVLSLGSAAFQSGDPCGAVCAMLEALASPRLLCTWQEGEHLAVELPLSETESVRLYFEREGMRPFLMEATENGQSVVFCNIENWTMGET
ncbi:MAG: hypothetical protein IJE26_04420 [Oscillospiraceae bacterium]|nr:hypothetical protein [Oscillospiraceae bacterium]